MNYEETKLRKALAICVRDDCDGCPYYDVYQCFERVKQGAHKLIIKQDQEIERLKDDYAKLQELFAQYQMASDKEIIAQKKQAKIDVLNELTVKAVSLSAIETYHICNLVDELLKEYE